MTEGAGGHQGDGWRTYSDPCEVGGLRMSGSHYAMWRNSENIPLAAGRDTGSDRSLGTMKFSSWSLGDRQERDSLGKPTLKMTRAGQVRGPGLAY